MKNIALIFFPVTVTEQQVLDHTPEGAEIAWHGSMPGGTAGTIQVPGSIPYRGGYAPLDNTQLAMLRFPPDYTPDIIQSWLDTLPGSPVNLVAVWYGTWIDRVVDEAPVRSIRIDREAGEEPEGVLVRSIRSWRVRTGLLEQSTKAEIKNHLLNYFPEGDSVSRMANWQGETWVGLDGYDGWLDDNELEGRA